jgi:serine protease inhibitor
VTFQILILGLFDAALNIDRSMHSLIAQDSKSDGNIIISPISIAAAMSLILLGAGGETKTEIGKLFGYDENTLLHAIDKLIFINFVPCPITNNIIVLL